MIEIPGFVVSDGPRDVYYGSRDWEINDHAMFLIAHIPQPIVLSPNAKFTFTSVPTGIGMSTPDGVLLHLRSIHTLPGALFGSFPLIDRSNKDLFVFPTPSIDAQGQIHVLVKNLSPYPIDIHPGRVLAVLEAQVPVTAHWIFELDWQNETYRRKKHDDKEDWFFENTYSSSVVPSSGHPRASVGPTEKPLQPFGPSHPKSLEASCPTSTSRFDSSGTFGKPLQAFGRSLQKSLGVQSKEESKTPSRLFSQKIPSSLPDEPPSDAWGSSTRPPSNFCDLVRFQAARQRWFQEKSTTDTEKTASAFESSGGSRYLHLSSTDSVPKSGPTSKNSFQVFDPFREKPHPSSSDPSTSLGEKGSVTWNPIRLNEEDVRRERRDPSCITWNEVSPHAGDTVRVGVLPEKRPMTQYAYKDRRDRACSIDLIAMRTFFLNPLQIVSVPTGICVNLLSREMVLQVWNTEQARNESVSVLDEGAPLKNEWGEIMVRVINHGHGQAYVAKGQRIARCVALEMSMDIEKQEFPE